MESPSLEFEQALWQQGLLRIAGIDEVGRGCISGPVIAAAVVLPVDCTPLEGVRDSKKLSLKQREAVYAKIKQQALGFAIGAASVEEIEHLNILHATYLAMQRALQRVQPVAHSLIDGRDNKKAQLGERTALVGGDQRCYSIACASIIAKVVRDRLMQQLALQYPGYAWERNAGYGTKAHLEALQELGVTPWHRRGYAPVQKVLATGKINEK